MKKPKNHRVGRRTVRAPRPTAARPATHRQAIVASFLEEGHFTSHIRRMRKVYAERQDVLLESARAKLAGMLDVLPSESLYAFPFGDEVEEHEQIPVLDSTPDLGPIEGSLVVFLLPEEANENRPLILHVPGPDGEEQGEVLGRFRRCDVKNRPDHGQDENGQTVVTMRRAESNKDEARDQLAGFGIAMRIASDYRKRARNRHEIISDQVPETGSSSKVTIVSRT